MVISMHTHPRYFVLFKYLFSVSAFLLPLYFLFSIFTKYSVKEVFSSSSLLPVFISIPFQLAFMLIPAYFYQNISVTSDGLLVDFLWKNLKVPWNELIEIKPTYISKWHSDDFKTYVVLTSALTPFHRLFGLLYGFSVKPAFIIYPTISEYKPLVKTIKKHTKKR